MRRVCVALLALFLALFPASSRALSLIRDAEIEYTLRKHADPVFQAAGLAPPAVRIFIVQDSAINAYVAGGSNMFIHTGLILATENPAMLLGVIAHETGHIAGGHIPQGAEKLKQAQLGMIFSYVLGAAAAAASGKAEVGAAIISGGQNVVERTFLAYTRTHEQAADQAALGYLDKLKISSSGMLQTFELLRRHELRQFGAPDPYMLTHPLSTQRIEHVRNHALESPIPKDQYPAALKPWHARMVAKLYGFIESPERTLVRYPLPDKSVPARLARAVAYYKMPDVARAVAEMDGLIAQSPKDPFFHELKGQILFENARVREALDAYRKAASIMPGSALILADLGRVQLAAGDPALVAEAIANLEKSSYLDNSNATVWRLLATAYGKEGNKAMSNLSLAEEAILAYDPKAAIQYVDLALDGLKEGTPSRLRAQDLKQRAIAMQREKEERDSPF